MQKNSHSHAEALANVIIGGLVSWLLTIWIFKVTPHFALTATVVYAVASYARSFLVRRFFNWLPTKWDMCHRVPRGSTETPATVTCKRLMARLLYGFRSIKGRLLNLCLTLARFG